MPARPLRAALVGAGRIGATYALDPVTARHYRYASHAQVLTEHPGLEWGACVDPDDRALETVGRLWEVPHRVRSLADLRGLYEPEVLILATPPADRPDQIRDVEASLRGVLVEKPLGMTAEDGESFLRACDSRSIPVLVNLWRRFDRRFVDLADGGLRRLIGRPQVVFGVYGNGLVNNGTHLVDFMRMLFGDIVQARAIGPGRRGTLPIPGDVDVAAALDFTEGVTAMIHPVDFGCYREVGLDVWGTDGRLSIMNEGLVIQHARSVDHRALSGAKEVPGDRLAPLDSTVGEALFHVYDNLVDMILGGAPARCSGETAVRSERVVQAILRSMEAGGRIEVP